MILLMKGNRLKLTSDFLSLSLSASNYEKENALKLCAIFNQTPGSL
jgi:hypothetical protein